jgi:hypothetical protein
MSPIEAYLKGKGVIEVFVCHQMHNCELEAGRYNGPKKTDKMVAWAKNNTQEAMPKI